MKDYFTQITEAFQSHPVNEDQVRDMDKVRETLGVAAVLITTHVPDSREKSIALTKMEEVMFWANAGISRHALEEEDDGN